MLSPSSPHAVAPRRQQGTSFKCNKGSNLVGCWVDRGKTTAPEQQSLVFILVVSCGHRLCQRRRRWMIQKGSWRTPKQTCKGSATKSITDWPVRNVKSFASTYDEGLRKKLVCWYSMRSKGAPNGCLNSLKHREGWAPWPKGRSLLQRANPQTGLVWWINAVNESSRRILERSTISRTE
jgi:hypothetical protein